MFGCEPKDVGFNFPPIALFNNGELKCYVGQELSWEKMPRNIRRLYQLSEIVFIEADFEEVIIPSVWEQKTFAEKVGPENKMLMWNFKDKGDRDVCLIPESTAIFQELWRDDWSKKYSKKNIFTVSKSFRYERPQKGRYREFTQFNVEMLGTKDSTQAKALLRSCLDALKINYEWIDTIKRGMNYYVEDGFEASVKELGISVAGGGTYDEGVGWAIGVDRLMLCM